MRQFLASCVLFALLVAFSSHRPLEAQLAANVPDLDALEKVARAFLAAQPGNPEAAHELLAKDAQGGVELHKARQAAQLESNARSWTRLKRKLEGGDGLDPWGKLPIKTSADYVALKPATHFALHAGLYRLCGGDAKRALEQKWFMTRRKAGLGPESAKNPLRGELIISVGEVTLENIAGDSVSVRCVPENSAWKVSAFSVSIGKTAAAFDGSLGGGVDSREALAEARAALGAMRDRARVIYQRNTRALINKAALGFLPDELRGSYYDDSCYKVVSVNPRKWGVMAAPADEGAWPILVVKCDLVSGESNFLEFDDMTAFQAAKLFDAADAEPTIEGTYGLYMKKGRSWMHRNEIRMEGMDPIVNYMKNEVLEVNSRGARVRTTMLDKDKKPMAGMEKGNDYEVAFQLSDQSPRAGSDFVSEDGGVVEAAGRKWKTTKTTYRHDSATVTWMSSEYPGLIIKTQSSTSTMTLEEFND